MSVDYKRGRYDQVRIIASPDGTIVKDALGNKMTVHGFSVSAHSGRPTTIVITLAAGQSNAVDIAGKPLFGIIDPESGLPRLVRKVIWSDGSETEFPEMPAQPVTFVKEGEAPPAARPAPEPPKSEDPPAMPPNAGEGEI